MKSLFYILFFILLSFEGFSQINFAQLSGRNTFTCVAIGTQCWMVRNLDVTTYRNGDVIPQVTYATEWAGLTTGAWCWYDNGADNGAIYGKLYNWYAVNDSRGLAPQGWHIPTDAEWTTLNTFLGVYSAGGKMKTTGTTRWTSPNTDATNESGFAGIPGSYRDMYGTFRDVGLKGYWWSVTETLAESSPTYVYNRYLSNSDGYLKSKFDLKENGFSVRCLRDLKIGDPYAGGIVAYILVNGDPGYDASVLHGLIAATSNQSTGISFHPYNNSTSATGTAIGTGLSNTNNIITNIGATSINYAAGLARAYRGGGYSDWYLPSKDELNKLYLNKTAIGGFVSSRYWSSTEYNNLSAWYQDFTDGASGATSKTTYISRNVRAIRAF